uniref:Protein kinase domain-containing protein n=1 Tax=viral metagenome TaxID=1070528 RepID=A0A6C0DDV0_9ZZZZ
MYGCVFTPALKCKGVSVKPDQEDPFHPPVSKLILTDDAKQEFAVSEIIRQLPGWKRYFAVSESICEPSPKQTEKELNECEVLNDTPLSEFRILSMPYRGTPVYRHRFQIKDFDFISFVRHMLEAGSMLAIFGIVHRDLHLGNVLVDHKQVPRIIDFNLSIRVLVDSITHPMVSHTFKPQLIQEPPDSALVMGIYAGHPSERIIQSIMRNKWILTKIQSLFGISKEDMADKLRELCKRSRSIQNGDTVGWFRTYWSKIDSWSIGVMIIDRMSSFSLWPEFGPMMESARLKLNPILRKMCAIHPVDRIDCVEALEMLDPNNFVLRNYGKAWLEKIKEKDSL